MSVDREAVLAALLKKSTGPTYVFGRAVKGSEVIFAKDVYDALLSSGVLADVRARALEDAAEELFYDGDTDQPLPGYTALLDRAVSEREGAA